MFQSKLVRLIDSFDDQQLKSAEKFLRSPYFNEDEVNVNLFMIITSALQLNDTKNLTKKVVFSAVFPGESFDDLKLRHALSRLLKLLEKFLLIEEIDSEPVFSGILKLNTFSSKKLETHFDHITRLTRKRNDESSQYRADYYYNNYLIEQKVSEYSESAGLRTQHASLEQSVKSLDNFYIISKLRHSCAILNNRNITTVADTLPLFDELMEHLKHQQYNDVPAIGIYHGILMTLLEEENEDHFFRLKSQLKEHNRLFSRQEARELFTYALNYCIRKINFGKTVFLNESFQLYKNALETKVLIDDQNQLSPWDYKNIVVIGLRIGEAKWVDHFIHHWKEVLPAAYRENAFKYNLAKFYFYKGEYRKLLRLLREVEFQDIFYNLDSKAMILKTYYELDDLVSLDYTAISFRVFLKRNKTISVHHKKNYLNLIRFTVELSKVKYKGEDWLKKFQNKVEGTKSIADVSWLKEKIAEVIA